ncbi:MAG: undecaprenyldiphospho-muramoylpentapeptide beta-N-acetylglucosaminyltransferase [Atopostipes suicloacalis]|nr:undecaprenyldiphospho-muramoylpentapeptide beta-N-acetylglucosaminyltransferase [Atopostipes suicloacalis]MDN6731096.1 undecaprenyldiphospho-muramoylpentapeptide beta-N-acetylglucosaminyltransferase [Atopostipes suicloacalis]
MKILLTGGGTGGHIYPALAVARRLEEIESDLELLYVGTSRGLESTIVPKEGIAFKSIEIEGFKRKLNFEGIKYNIKSLGLFIKSIFQAKKIIREFKPDIVLGTGGYVSAPMCYAASKAGIATIVHEQNSFLGLTNKFLLHFVDKLAISFEEIYEQTEKYSEKVVFTGNPRSQELSSKEKVMNPNLFGLDSSKKIVLVLGGSRGAEKINQSIIEAYPALIEKDYQLIFATGEKHYDKVVKQLDAISPLSENKNIVVKAYIDNIIELMQYSTLLISRSGATTLAEITALGLASILIPSPYVTDDHQTKNAMSLVNNEAAILLEEKNLIGQALMVHLDELLSNQEKLNQMANASKEMAEPFATDQLVQVMIDELKRKK